jgi:hypothetical protein
MCGTAHFFLSYQPDTRAPFLGFRSDRADHLLLQRTTRHRRKTEVPASGTHSASITARRRAAVEADIPPCARDSASLRPIALRWTVSDRPLRLGVRLNAGLLGPQGCPTDGILRV